MSEDAKRIIQSMVVVADALIETCGMIAENQYRLNVGHQIAYVEEAFSSVAEKMKRRIAEIDAETENEEYEVGKRMLDGREHNDKPWEA